MTQQSYVNSTPVPAMHISLRLPAVSGSYIWEDSWLFLCDHESKRDLRKPTTLPKMKGTTYNFSQKRYEKPLRSKTKSSQSKGAFKEAYAYKTKLSEGQRVFLKHLRIDNRLLWDHPSHLGKVGDLWLLTVSCGLKAESGLTAKADVCHTHVFQCASLLSLQHWLCFKGDLDCS